MTNPPLVLAFGDPQCRSVGLSGGKGASIAAMVQQAMPVPAGFIVTSAAFIAAVDAAKLRQFCRAGDMVSAQAIVAAARPPAILVAAHFAALDGPVAVRSSACAEDSQAASYAGQQATFLNVDGLAAVLEKIVECWLSFFSERAVFYRAEKGSMDDIAMAVVVQQMISSRKSGVLFTVDPVHGRRDRVVVEAAFGLGEKVVDGAHTPDHYALDRKGTLKRSHIVGTQVLNESELKRLAEIGRKLEEMQGCPQDIEWAFDENGDLFLLQSRPITTI